MDSSRFDDLSKALATPRARRRFLIAAAVTLGGLLPETARIEIAARKRKKRKKQGSAPPPPPPCIPVCDGKTCGGDGCGGQCGTCLDADTCQNDTCVCATPGAPGPGDICSAPGACCPYTEVSERSCTRGAGGCQTFLPVCRYGFGGKCLSGCDCLGELECRGGVCRCPGDRHYLSGGVCCGEGLTRCGNRCCPPGACFCFPGADCRCT